MTLTTESLPLVGTASPRVVIAHDYLTQTGGAERVALGLLRTFPGARLVTAAYDPERTYPGFRDHDIETLWVDRVPALRKDPRRALPFLARAWSNHHIDDADLVICSSSGWSHGVQTSGKKLVFCYNPARWLYQADDYLAGAGAAAGLALRALGTRLRAWDRAAAQSADAYLTISSAVAGRVLEAYGLDSTIMPPPVTLDPDGPQRPVPGIEPGFYLSVARPRGYKNTHVVCEAVQGMADARLVVLGSLPARASGTWDSQRLRGVGRVSDAELRWLYANCAAVVSASHEDFGLTPLEGNLFGAPAVVLRAGGFLDTLVEGMTGCFIEAATPEAVQDALRTLPKTDPQLLRAYASGFQPKAFDAKLHAFVDQVLGRTIEIPLQAAPAA